MVRLLEHAEQLARKALRSLPNGTWTAEDLLDDDGVSDDTIPMKVTVTIDDDRFLVDFTEDNGATVLWPGTHKLNQVPDPDADYSDRLRTRAIGPAGTCVVWDAALWHATGRNTSDHLRHSALGFYHRRWIRGTINVEHVIPPEVLARMSPEMHRLIGLDDWPPDYSAVKKMTPEQIADLTPEQRDVLGFMIY